MAEIRHVLTANADQLLRTMEDVTGAFEEHADTTSDAEKQSKKLRGTTVALGAALAATTAIVVKGISEAIAYGDALGKMSERTGLSVESLSALKLAAENSDTSLDTLARGLSTLSKGMFDAATKGTGPAAEAFAALGISATDASGNLRDSEVVLNEVSDAFAGMANGTEKAALAAKLFGGAGRELIPMLNQGADGLEANKRLSEELGLVWSDEASQAAEDFNDSIANLGRVADGFFGQAAQFYLPTLADIAAGAVLAARAFTTLGNAQVDADAAAREAAQDAINAQADRIEGLKRQLESSRLLDESLMDLSTGEVTVSEETRNLTAEVERQIEVLRRLKGELGAEAGLLTDEARRLAESAAARAESIGGIEEQTKRTRKSADAIDEEAEALLRVEEAQTRRRSILDELTSITTAATDSMLGDSERLIAQHEREVARITDLVHEAVASEEVGWEQKLEVITQGHAAKLALEAELQAGLAELRDEEHRAELDRIDAETAAKKQAASDVLMSAGALTDSLVALTGVITDAVVEGTEEESEARKQALMDAFVANKIVAVAQAAVNTALAISNAIGNAPNPIVGAVLAVAAGIAGAAAMAGIIAQPPPQFHDGGLVDEIDIRARAGEAVLPPQTVRRIGGEQGINRLIRTGSTGPQELTVVQKLDHRVLDAQVHRAVKRTGSPLDAALRATNPRGTGRRNPYQART